MFVNPILTDWKKLKIPDVLRKYIGDSPIFITHILLFINGYAINIFAEEQHLEILKKEGKA